MKKRILWGVIILYISIFIIVTIGVCKVDFKIVKPIKPCRKTEIKSCNGERGIRR